MAKSQRRINAEKQIRSAKAQVVILKGERFGARQTLRVANENMKDIEKDLKQTQTFITKQTKALKNL